MTKPTGLRRLWSYAGRYRARVLLAILWTTLGKIMDVVPEVLIGAVIDVVVRGQDSVVASVLGVSDRWHQLLWLAALNAIVWILESVFGYLSSLSWRNLSQAIEHEIRGDLYRHIQSLELSWFEESTSGGLNSVINDDINQLERFLDIGPSALIALFWNVVLVGAVFFASSWLVATLAFAPIPFIVLGSVAYQRRLKPRYQRVRAAVAELGSLLTANLGGITTIKAFSAEDREAARVESTSNDYREANRAAIRYSSLFVPLIRMLILFGFSCTLIVGGWLVLNGELEVALYSVLVFMTQRLLWPLTSLGETLDQYQRAMASTGRIFGLLDTTPSMEDGKESLPELVRGDVRYEDVSFTYRSGGPVLESISLHVQPGSVHALVGATGSGKSTLIRLLLRFHDPTAGRVLIDGQDLTTLRLSSLRRAIGYVSQDVFLHHGSIRENIAYGRPDASDSQIEQAARAAEIHEFVASLPRGYDTLVGERGQKLSGGQRQRISLARAILRDPAILILDEATSAVDNETEAAIQRSLQRITKGRTTIVVAHRLSTVRDADCIWVLEAGTIVESGTHDQLVAAGGLYAALWRVQTGASPRDSVATEDARSV